MPHLVTRQWVKAHATPNGGWTRAQLAVLGIPWPPTKGWLDAVEGTFISLGKARQFEQLMRRDEGTRMSTKLSKAAYERYIQEDLDWLQKQPDCPQNHHIQHIVADSLNTYYPLPLPPLRETAQDEDDT